MKQVVCLRRFSTPSVIDDKLKEILFLKDLKLSKTKHLEDVFHQVIQIYEEHGFLSIKIIGTFLQSLRHIKPRNMPKNKDEKVAFKELESKAIDCVVKTIEELKGLKSVVVENILHNLATSKQTNPVLIEAIKNLLLYNSVFDNSRDISETLNLLGEMQDLFGSEIWIRLADNQIANQIRNWNCQQFMEIIIVYKKFKRTYMIRELINSYKFLIVEDIDNIPVKELIVLISVYKYDLQLKSFIGSKLREKIIKNPNLNSKMLLNTIVETLDLPDLRREIIKYTLNSELFYAFPVGYHVTLLRNLSKHEYHIDFYDLVKTIQIQLCLLEKQMTSHTIDKLCKLHQQIPILNSHFLCMLIKLTNQLRIPKKIDNRIFNLNISLINLPSISNQQLIEEYELALINELNINTPQQFNIGNIMKFLSENPKFTQYGFFQGFSDMLLQVIQSDEKSKFEVWAVSVILKILQMGCTDKEFIYRIEKLIEKNFEKMAQLSLIKFTTLVLHVCPDNARYKELLHRRLQKFKPDSINDLRLSIQFLPSIAKLDVGINQIFPKFIQYNLKSLNNCLGHEIQNILLSLHIMKLTETSEYAKYYEKIFDRILLFEKAKLYDLIMNLEYITTSFMHLPLQLKDRQLEIYSRIFQKMLTQIQDPSKRVFQIFVKYQKILQQVYDSFANLPKDDQLMSLRPIIKECLQNVEEFLRNEMESKETSTDTEEEDDMQQRNSNQRGKQQKNKSF